MDSYENEASKFAAQRTKLKNICEAHDLTYTFIKNSYPIKLVIRPLGGVGEQMSMLEEATEDNYISPGASILFTVKDGNLTYRMSKTFTIEDALFGKIKNIFKNMHSYYCQFFFRELIESGRLKAIGGKMPEIPETTAKEPEEKAPDLPPDAEKLEEIEDDALMKSKIIGVCPNCGKPVVEREKGWFCENRECRFVLWKDNAFFKRLGKRLDAHVADKLLRDGRVRLKDCKSAKGKTYNATVLLSCEADGRSKFSLEFESGC